MCQVQHPKVDWMRKTIMFVFFSFLFFTKSYNVIFDLWNFLFSDDQRVDFFLLTNWRLTQFSCTEATFLMIICLWTRYTIFIHWNHKLYWQFAVVWWVTQVLHKNRQVSRWFMFLNKIHNFYQVNLLRFWGTL